MVAVYAGLATGTATAPAPVAGDRRRVLRRAGDRARYRRDRLAILERKRQWRQDHPGAASARDRRYDTQPAHYERHKQRERARYAARRTAVEIGTDGQAATATGTAQQPVPAIGANAAPA